MRRRTLLGTLAVAMTSVIGMNSAQATKHAAAGQLIELPPLPYAYDALMPYMSRETLEYHHDKHHKTSIDNANRLLDVSNLAALSVDDICKQAFDEKQAGIVNNVGQHYNHLHFWNWMKPNGGGKKLPGSLAGAIDSGFGGYDQMRDDFIQAGLTQFGSGWVWLAMKDGKLIIMKTPNGENPLMHDASPVLGCDVWEHSYYIDYRNARQKYLEAFVDHLINWDYVEHMHANA
jgi:superoxide dismutase, Fe-Mn family